MQGSLLPCNSTGYVLNRVDADLMSMKRNVSLTTASVKWSSAHNSKGYAALLAVPHSFFNATLSEAKGMSDPTLRSALTRSHTAATWRMNFFRLDTPLVSALCASIFALTTHMPTERSA